MPTGSAHLRWGVGTLGAGTNENCRCTIGEDHNDYDVLMSEMVEDPDDDESEDDDESLSVYEAADIWLSNGMDEDYMFGYSAEELRRAGGA